MPIYEYECTQCGQRIEELVLRRSEEPSHCAACGGALRRLISAHAIRAGAGDEGGACADGACAPVCGAGACPACE